MIILIDEEKQLYKIRQPFIIKPFSKLEIQQTFSKLIKGHLPRKKYTRNDILNDNMLKAFPMRPKAK